MSETGNDPFTPLRQAMTQIIVAHTEATQGLTGIAEIGERVLNAMRRVPRHEFVPTELRAYAHADGPLPIGWEKTISQPFIAALMTDLLAPTKDERVLEIGTGLGYHTAILSELAGTVFTVEVIEELANEAKRRLADQGSTNIEMRIGNGYNGWPDHAPFDKIIAAAAPELVPPALLSQLKPGGRMVIPAGLDDAQQLMVVDKDGQGKVTMRDILGVRFAPMEGVG